MDPSSSSGEPTVNTVDWRTHLQPDSRARIVNHIMYTFWRHLSVSGQEGLNEFRNIAERFEEEIFTVANGQADYLRRISLKLLTVETQHHYQTVCVGAKRKRVMASPQQ